MAIYYVDCNVVKQRQSIDSDPGRRTAAIDAFNYIARQHQYSKRDDLLYIHSGNMPSWTKPGQHSSLWHGIDTYERANARCALNLRFALPIEATDAERIEIAKAIAADVCALGQPYTLVIHHDAKNPHAHLLIYERLTDGIHRDKVQYFRRAAPAGKPAHLGGARKFETKKAWIYEMREKIETHTNAYLVPRGFAPVSRLSYRARGIDKQPQRKLSGAIRKTIERFSLKYEAPQEELRRVWVERQCLDRAALELYAINYLTERALAADAARVEAERKAQAEAERLAGQSQEDQARREREAKPEPSAVPSIDWIPLVVRPKVQPPPPSTRAEWAQAIINSKARIAGLKAVIDDETPKYNEAKRKAETVLRAPVEAIKPERDQAKADIDQARAELARLTSAAAVALSRLPAEMRARFQSGELGADTGPIKALRSGAGYGKPWACLRALKKVRDQEADVADLQAVFDEVDTRFKEVDGKLSSAIRSMERIEQTLTPYRECLDEEKGTLAAAESAHAKLEAEYRAKYDPEMAAFRNTSTDDLLATRAKWADHYRDNPPRPDDLNHVEMIAMVLEERRKAAEEARAPRRKPTKDEEGLKPK